MPQTNCAMYYRCREGHKVNYECPFGMMFDFYRQKCISNTSESIKMANLWHKT